MHAPVGAVCSVYSYNILVCNLICKLCVTDSDEVTPHHLKLNVATFMAIQVTLLSSFWSGVAVIYSSLYSISKKFHMQQKLLAYKKVTRLIKLTIHNNGKIKNNPCNNGNGKKTFIMQCLLQLSIQYLCIFKVKGSS